MKFKIQTQSKKSKARLGELETSHGKVQTPVFMPCGTVGTVKGISPEELSQIGFKIILGNTYHLYLRPGEKLIKKFGGLQKYINWPGAILTDSGGYQVFSLGKNYVDRESKEIKSSLVSTGSRGVWFKSHLDGSKHLFSPESVIDIQKDLGSDIVMVLDECTEHPATQERAEKSMELTHRWAKRAIDYWQSASWRSRGEQAIFGIIQGSTYQNLRQESAQYLSSLPFDGLAVGGVSVGEGKKNMYQVMKWTGESLAKDQRPHYLMGIGEPEDIIEGVKNGFDMFDCVLPTRLGRHGTIWVTSNWKKFSKIDLRKTLYREDKKVLMPGCSCPACKGGFSRSYISHLIREKEMLGMRLASLHNLWILNQLTEKIRDDISAGKM